MIEQYLAPINPDKLGYHASGKVTTLGSKINAYIQSMPPMPQNSIVIVGVGEDRGAVCNAGCAEAPDDIRHSLYTLALPCEEAQITDIGNVIQGQYVEDTYCALAEIAAEVMRHGNTLIILGGSQDLTFAAYKGFEQLDRIISIAAIDPCFDLEENDEITSRTWLRNIIMQSPNFLFSHTNVGYQTYYVGQPYIKLMGDLKFDAYSLGEMQHDMDRTEAVIRDSDLVSIDLGAVRQSDAPAHGNPSPHGFYGEELCQIMRYAGLSNKTQCIGVFELNPLYDNRHQTANMVAQALWYFLDGYYNRTDDNPRSHPENCKHFLVPLEDQNIELDFYKSKLSNRWWVRVPCENERLQELYTSEIMLPCTYSDYLQAMKGEIPSEWWKYYSRLNTTV